MESFRRCEVLERAVELELSWSRSCLSSAVNLPLKTRLRTRTGRKKREEAATHREPSRGRPPPGTTQ